MNVKCTTCGTIARDQIIEHAEEYRDLHAERTGHKVTIE